MAVRRVRRGALMAFWPLAAIVERRMHRGRRSGVERARGPSLWLTSSLARSLASRRHRAAVLFGTTGGAASAGAAHRAARAVRWQGTGGRKASARGWAWEQSRAATSSAAGGALGRARVERVGTGVRARGGRHACVLRVESAGCVRARAWRGAGPSLGRRVRCVACGRVTGLARGRPRRGAASRPGSAHACARVGRSGACAPGQGRGAGPGGARSVRERGRGGRRRREEGKREREKGK